MPGSSSTFIPTLNAITTSQDLQWMVQPTVITSMPSAYSRSHPYSHALPNLSSVSGHSALHRPGVIKTIGTTVGRRRRDEQVTTRVETTACNSLAESAWDLVVLNVSFQIYNFMLHALMWCRNLLCPFFSGS